MKKLLFPFLVILAIGFTTTSCKKDKEGITTPLTANEANEKIQATANSLKNDMQKIAKSEGFKAMNNLSNLFEGLQGEELTKAKLSSTFKVIIFKNLIENVKTPNGRLASDITDGFNEMPTSLDEIKGKYVWDKVSKKLKRTGEASTLIIEFPSSKDATSNDAILNVTEYSAVKINEYTLLQKKLVGEIKIGRKQIFSINSNSDYNSKGMPKSVNSTVFLKPLTLNANGKLGNNIDNLSDIKELKVDLTLKDVNIKGMIDPSKIDIIGGDINQAVDLELFISNRKAGDIIVKEGDLYVKFLDGSVKSLDDFLKPLADELSKMKEKLK